MLCFESGTQETSETISRKFRVMKAIKKKNTCNAQWHRNNRETESNILSVSFKGFVPLFDTLVHMFVWCMWKHSSSYYICSLIELLYLLKKTKKNMYTPSQSVSCSYIVFFLIKNTLLKLNKRSHFQSFVGWFQWKV